MSQKKARRRHRNPRADDDFFLYLMAAGALLMFMVRNSPAAATNVYTATAATTPGAGVPAPGAAGSGVNFMAANNAAVAAAQATPIPVDFGVTDPNAAW